MQVPTCWTEALAPTDALPIIDGIALAHLADEAGGKVGKVLRSLIQERDYHALCMYDLDPGAEHWTASQYIACASALGLYKKSEWLDIGIDREKVAYEAFIQSEAGCLETNRFFRALDQGKATCLPGFARLLGRVRSKIRRVLGPVPVVDSLDLRFGPGSTVSIRKRDASFQKKLWSMPECSHALFASVYLPEVLRSLPHWCDLHCTGWSIDPDDYVVQEVSLAVMPGRLEFVPKNAKTHRSIVVEPSLNGVFQAGIGDYIAKRLKRCAGVDISDQSRNQRLAREGSISNELATLDLSAASDSIAYELVKTLVPEDWFLLLKGARTGVVSYGDSEISLQKFSSMGNGFTFPLETLIFWAVTTACYDTAADIDHVGVYGDDIICPVNRVEKVIQALRWCGFAISETKSFTRGPFRESCGADYRLGIPVRPFFLKKEVSASTLYTMHNSYFRSGMFELCELVKSFIPKGTRLYGPDGYGDGHLLSLSWPRIKLSPKLVRKGYCGSKFATYTLGARKDIPRYCGDYVSPLYSIYRKGVDTRTPVLRQASSAQDISKSGRPIWPLPGSDGYKRIEIYTFK